MQLDFFVVVLFLTQCLIIICLLIYSIPCSYNVMGCVADMKIIAAEENTALALQKKKTL